MFQKHGSRKSKRGSSSAKDSLAIAQSKTSHGAAGPRRGSSQSAVKAPFTVFFRESGGTPPQPATASPLRSHSSVLVDLASKKRKPFGAAPTRGELHSEAALGSPYRAAKHPVQTSAFFGPTGYNSEIRWGTSGQQEEHEGGGVRYTSAERGLTKTWACGICTFANEKQEAPVCAVCGSVRAVA